MRAVFVCVENSNRSQIAEAFARMAGIEAYSAGLVLGPRESESYRGDANLATILQLISPSRWRTCLIDLSTTPLQWAVATNAQT